jgi:hypothetical protein
VTAERDAALGRAITRLEDATGDEPPEYWQALLDDLEPFVDLENVTSNTSIAFKYVVWLRDRTDRAGSPQGRAVCVDDATFFLWQALVFPH